MVDAMEQISACYYPTKVLMLDDSQSFLRIISNSLSTKHTTFELFTDIEKMLNSLNKKFDPYPDRYIKLIDENKYQHRVIDIDLYELHKEVYRQDRFNTISAVIIDYDMPQMNGLEVCKSISNSYVQKILLTGATDEYLAVEAFNAGLIDNFVKKQDPDMLEKLNNILIQSQEKYFHALSSTIVKVIELDQTRITAINDLEFVKLFSSLVKDYNIIEYYLFEAIGCFLMLDEEGQAYGLFLADDEIMDAMVLGAVDHEGKRNLDIAKMLVNREKILCYHHQDEASIPYVNNWLKYLYKANKLVGSKNTYYWAFAPEMLDIDQGKIYSFALYKQQLSEKIVI